MGILFILDVTESVSLQLFTILKDNSLQEDSCVEGEKGEGLDVSQMLKVSI